LPFVVPGVAHGGSGQGVTASAACAQHCPRLLEAFARGFNGVCCLLVPACVTLVWCGVRLCEFPRAGPWLLWPPTTCPRPTRSTTCTRECQQESGIRCLPRRTSCPCAHCFAAWRGALWTQCGPSVCTQCRETLCILAWDTVCLCYRPMRCGFCADSASPASATPPLRPPFCPV
jgi:hypothetical protein